jgi:putative SOS response-associated peptidase YedK
MCYDVKALLETQLQRAKRHNNTETIAQIERQLAPHLPKTIHHASGFSHPQLLIYTNQNPFSPLSSTWGLAPHWLKDEVQLNKFWNNTLNARAETLFEKPAFKRAAKSQRCLIYLDGFYEHHHFKGNTFPFFIQHKQAEPLIVAGIYHPWKNPANGETLNTFSIVTTKANELMAKIHNNPKLTAARMPVIFPEALADDWLQPLTDELDKQALEDLLVPYPSAALAAHTVGKLRGKNYVGNVPDASKAVNYPQLEF